MIPSWSFSRLLDFEQCPYRVKLRIIDKIPEPQNKYAARGEELHKHMEMYIKGETPTLHNELSKFSAEMSAARDVYARGNAIVEQEWAHDLNWNAVDWRAKNAWARMKLDLFVLTDGGTTGIVVDGKSGKRFNNELKHAQQGQLYAGVACLRYPKLKKIITEFWYFDLPAADNLTKVTYTTQQAARHLISFEKRALRMTQATEFPAKPSIFTCKYCAYRKPDQYGGDGTCKSAVDMNVFAKKK